VTEEQSGELTRLWHLLRARLDDPQVRDDADRLPDVMADRASGRHWPDAVAGDMERRYSPGRTWEATARAMVQLLSPGRVLDVASGDGVIGELLHRRAVSVDCVDLSPRVVEAGQKRVGALDNVRFHQGDMHSLPFADRSFETVLMLHALTFSTDPAAAVGEAARVLADNGSLVCATLNEHRHHAQVEAYGHVNNGFAPETLTELFDEAGLDVGFCEITSVEKKSPNFEIITLLAKRS
jgi:ArsR family transcriptional regulator